MITEQQLVKLGASSANATKYVKAINDTCIKFNINTEARISAFLSQIFEESGCLSVVKENLNYSAKRLMQVWPTRFPTLASTEGYVMNSVALANKVYGGRGGNIAGTSDGGKFLGRGMIQITFRSNYLACGKALGLDLLNHPELLELPEYAVMSAGWFWDRANCNRLADGDSEIAVKAVTKVINGGYGNLDIRLSYWKKAKTIGFKLEHPFENISIKEDSAFRPLPNVVLPKEDKSAIMQHNPTTPKFSISQMIADFLIALFRGK